MAERLGEALLDLRTNDAGFTSGVEQARGKAQQLGAQLDRTKGSSSQLAAEMVTTGRSAAQMGQGFERAGQQVTVSAGQQRQGMQQLSFQIGDIATMYSLGARPAQIFASQIGQVTQAVQLMSGGTSRVAAFLGGPWGIALTAATIVLAPFIGKLFEAEDALEGVEFASSKLGDAQDILASVMDKTTGRINAQSHALVALARAQAAAGRVGAMQRQAAARSELQSISQGGFGDITADVNMMGGVRVGRADNGQRIVELFRSGRLTATQAEQQLRARMRSGIISEEAYFRAAQAITAFDVEGANVQIFDDALAGLDGDSAAARRVLGPQKEPRTRKGPKGRTDADRAEDFRNDSFSLERQNLQARLSLANTAEDRADLQRDLLSLERRQQVAAIEATDLTRKQKDALIKQVETLLGKEPEFDKQGNLIVSANRGLEGEIIARELAVRQLQQSQRLADVRFDGETEALRNALALADTEAERKEVSLRLLEAEEKFERIRLQTIIDAAARGEAEAEAAELARAQLANLEANAAGRRAATARQNETEVERYLRTNINRTPEQINEAIDGIQIDGLESLNDGLTRAFMGVESLGDVFSRVADQIIADLLRIAIQQAIIRPLANVLFAGGGEGGGSGGGLLGSLFGRGLFGSGGVGGPWSMSFAGAFATGGKIPTGQFGIVGEEGPELAFAGPGGLGILSNPESRALIGGAGGGTNVSISIPIDATGADQAAIARLNAKMDQLSAELPGKIITTVQDAGNRRIINLGGVR